MLRRSRVGSVVLVGALGACGPGSAPPVSAEDSSTSMGGAEQSTSTSTDPGSGSGSGSDGSGPAMPSTTSGPADTGTDDTGAVFIDEPDGGGVGFECDMFAQDCPAGEKCMPWDDTGGNSWNATRCSPIADDPGEPGDACMVEGSGTSGIDDCELGVMCWDVDPETNVGTCVALCVGDESRPVCEDPDTACAISSRSAFVICLPVCDPVIQDCAEGQACYPILDWWSCVPDASGELGAYGDPCELLNVCDPSLVCLSAGSLPAGEACEGSAGCCTEVCDLADPAGDMQCAGAAGGQTCLPWYEEGAAPPGYEEVGVCSLPA
jgi:hypothetical protein